MSGMLPFYVSVAVCMSPVRRPYQAGHEIFCNGHKAEKASENSTKTIDSNWLKVTKTDVRT